MGSEMCIRDRCPKKGPITGSFLSEVMSHAFLLSDPEKTKLHGAGLMSIGNAMPDVVLLDADESTDLEEEVLPAPETATAQDVPAAGHVEAAPVAVTPVPAQEGDDGEFSTADAVAKVVKDMGNVNLLGMFTDMFADIDDEPLDDGLTVYPSATMASPTVQPIEAQTAQPEPLAVPSPATPVVQQVPVARQVEEPEDLWL